MILAADLQAVPADWLKNSVIVLLAIASPLIAIWAGGRRRKIEPDPLRVQKVDNLVTKDYCLSSHATLHQRLDGHDAAITAIRGEMRKDREDGELAARTRSAGIYHKLDDLRLELSDKMDAIRREGKADTEGVHTRINDVLAAVSELRGKVDK